MTKNTVKAEIARAVACAAAALCLWGAGTARGEALLQYFNQSHAEIAAKIPELAEAGYSAIWIPPPTKANGGMSVGYDLFDPFDIGNTPLRGQYATRYGTETDLLHLIEMAHRFGIRVYFDNVMNHRAYDVPGYDENTPADVYPGMVAEDFHLQVTSDGYYRKWENIDWRNFTEWDVMYRPLSDLIDIAHEAGDNGNFGTMMGDHHAKPWFVRHPDHPEFYDRMPHPSLRPDQVTTDDAWNWTPGNGRNLYVGFGGRGEITDELIAQYPDFFNKYGTNGVTKEMLADYPNFFKEDVGGYLCRAVRWLVNKTHVDGLRLDAVKHVPYYFFGATGDGKDYDPAGYIGNAQWQFDRTRGFEDEHYRDSVFDIEHPRDDLMIFGEHLGTPPAQGPYIDAGMRLVDDDLRQQLNWRFGANELWGYHNPGAGGFGPSLGVMHAQSHDNDYTDRKQLQHAYYYMRTGLGLVYTDGNNRAAVLPGSGGAFPRWACTDFLGQWQQSQIPTLLSVHENFAIGTDAGIWEQGNHIAWQRGTSYDGNGDGAWVRLLVMFNSLWNQFQTIQTAGSFPQTPGSDDDTYLYNYASTYGPYMTHYKGEGWPDAPYAWASDLASEKVEMPGNSYALWAIKNPDPSDLWSVEKKGLSPVISLYENGEMAPWTLVDRVDGVDGDPNFNPNNVDDDDPTDFTYRMPIPVVKGTNVTIRVRSDGSAKMLRLRLDGGMDFGNGIQHNHEWCPYNGDDRDSPPGCANDWDLGFENCDDAGWFTLRIWPEKFAAPAVDNCHIGSAGAVAYEVSGGVPSNGTTDAVNGAGTDHGAVNWVFHDATGTTQPVPLEGATPTRTTNTYTLKASVAGYDGSAEGFGAWDTSSFNGNAWYFAGNQAFQCGITGFEGNQAYGLYCNPADGGGYASLSRPILHGHGLKRISVDVGMLWDSNIQGRYKGVEFQDAQGNAIFGIQMEGCPDGCPGVNYYGTGISGTWSESYGSAISSITLTRTATGYSVTGTNRNGVAKSGISVTTDADIASFRAYMDPTDDSASRQLYFDNLTYTAEVEETTAPQFSATAAGATVWAKTSIEDNVRMRLYYTVDGNTWPEGAAGEPANRTTRVAEGTWKTNWEGTDPGSWWRFDLPAAAGQAALNGTLRYKLSAFRQQGADGNGYETVQPHKGPDAIAKKKQMLTEWTIPDLNLKELTFHKHNDHNSPTTGFAEGFHLVTAKVYAERDQYPFRDEAPVPNTFRQTFYVDAELPRGQIEYPAADGDWVDGSEYGVVVRTDETVDDVWYWIDDVNDSNDGVGNGRTTNGVSTNAVVWGRADQVMPWTTNMATDMALPKVWRFTYRGIAGGQSNATIYVRLRECSSAKTNAWSAAGPSNDDTNALHVTQLTRTVVANGANHYLYFDWPSQRDEMVEYGWKLRLKHDWSFAADLDDNGAKALFTIRFESPNGSGGTNETVVYGTDDSVHYQWNHPWDNELLVDMPNIYTGDESDKHFVEVKGVREIGSQTVTLIATNTIRTRGPVQPTCIITTPPETDSDGVKYVIEMPDLPPEVLATNAQARVTPIVVQTDWAVTNLELSFTSPSGFVPQLSASTVVTNGTALLWSYDWTLAAPGSYTFTATAWADKSLNTNLDIATNCAVRNATIQFRQQSDTSDKLDFDWDDDGISNTNETTQAALPASNDELWTQDQVFAHFSSGRTDEKSPDTDGDGLPDGLELGVRWSIAGSTDLNADTNGDGWKNFLSDCDPPFYNTRDNAGKVRGIADEGSGADRTAIMIGTVTDPRNADTDYDGLPDGVEDANRNGWVDGDGEMLAWDGTQTTDRTPPNGIIDGSDVWKETSPGVADSDRDGLSDGYGEDTNFNGRVDIFLKAQNGTLTELLLSEHGEYRIGDEHSRAVNYTALFADYAVDGQNNGAKQNGGWPRLIILETDPLCTDTDNDGLPDGWETRYGLDPLDNGVYNFRTGEAGNADNGPDGNPDGDQIYDDDAQPIDYTNARELASGTNPVVEDSPQNPGGSGSIVVGDGAEIGKVNDTIYHREFLDWSLDDLLALDDYNRGGNSSDIYRWWDGRDSSRDIVAFYVHDGGQEGVTGADGRKGDGRIYFRVDFDDLQATAESGSLDIYVAINVGNYGLGEYCLPDSVNAGTEMRWNALVAVYDSANGVLYVDRDKTNNTSTIFGSLEENGVAVLDGGFGGAHFNSQLDAVMWSIPRKALMDLDWGGDIDNLMFQVYTTRDGTGDSEGQPGDKGGLNDFTDVVGDWKDDWICSDYRNDYTSVANHSYLTYCIGRKTGDWRVFNHCGRHAKLALVAHGNQAIEPGATIQNIVDNGQGAGYGRPVKIHNIYTNCPMNLHITPTLALALQWAEVGTDKTWFSGPALNDAIRAGVASGGLALLGSTFSDHIPRYFSDDFNRENVALATATLNEIYGDGRDVVSTNVFWSPERVVDSEWLLKVRDLGYQATLVDQTPHLLDWFGRERRDWYVGTEAYKVQNFWIDTTGNGNFVNVKAFALSTAANDFRYVNNDEGLALDLRRLFLRRARGGDSVISSIFYMWEDFASSDNANAYDKSLRWIANHPWIQVVTLDEALGDESLLSRSIDVYQTTAPLSQEAQDWVHHACNENYDNWYFGNAERGLESLAGKAFEIRQGQTMEAVYGTTTNGILKDAWTAVAGITNAQVKKLAEATIFASAFETAFHNEGNNDLSRWSYGDYIYPALDPTNLMSMAWRAQSRTRLAAVYAEVDDWAGRTTGLQAYSKDVDLDGEVEWILRNDKVMAVFEAEGGVMVGAWLKDGTNVWQMVGNFAAQPETGYETQSTGQNSQRGTAMKDITINGEPRAATKYGVTKGTGSLTFAVSGGPSKTVRLADAATGAFQISYAGLNGGGGTNYVRNGLSPDLATLMATGQRCLSESIDGDTGVAVTATRGGRSVTAAVRATAGRINTGAHDKADGWNTVDMRNAAHVRQVEVEGTSNLAYTLEFSADGASPEADTDSDGMPDWWETEHGLDPNSAEGNDGADGDPDGDGFKNLYEYWAGTIPTGEQGKNQYIGWESAMDAANGWALTFQCVSGEWYAVEGADSGALVSRDWQQLGGGFQATNAHHTWVDTNRVFTNRFYRLRIPSIR